MRLSVFAAFGGALVAGCATTNYTPMERYLNRYAGAEVAAAQCPAYGGYGSAVAMRTDAEKNLAEARKLGATDTDVQKARSRVSGNFTGAVVLVGPMQACNSFINSLAWAGTSKPVAVSQTKNTQGKK
ncbi:hypothetical protein WYI_23625 [Ochrobactrum sp. CDB2]|nr:hypothetical protein WYI_23625 [Ochrobactrum sp. CDB2]